MNLRKSKKRKGARVTFREGDGGGSIAKMRDVVVEVIELRMILIEVLIENESFLVGWFAVGSQAGSCAPAEKAPWS